MNLSGVDCAAEHFHTLDKAVSTVEKQHSERLVVAAGKDPIQMRHGLSR